jgi:stage V sporulation protein AA
MYLSSVEEYISFQGRAIKNLSRLKRLIKYFINLFNFGNTRCMLENIVLIQPKSKIIIHESKQIYLKDIALIECNNQYKPQILELPIIFIEEGSGYNVIHLIDIAAKINTLFINLDIRFIGQEDILIEFSYHHKNNFLITVKSFFIAFFIAVCAGAAIMNFHADIDMMHVLRALNKIITGKEVTIPYIAAIPYSIGVGLGVYVFFNFIVNKKNKKIQMPSPLKIEISSYTKTMEDYLKTESKNSKNIN